MANNMINIIKPATKPRNKLIKRQGLSVFLWTENALPHNDYLTEEPVLRDSIVWQVSDWYSKKSLPAPSVIEVHIFAGIKGFVDISYLFKYTFPVNCSIADRTGKAGARHKSSNRFRARTWTSLAKATACWKGVRPGGSRGWTPQAISTASSETIDYIAQQCTGRDKQCPSTTRKYRPALNPSIPSCTWPLLWVIKQEYIGMLLRKSSDYFSGVIGRHAVDLIFRNDLVDSSVPGVERVSARWNAPHWRPWHS